MFVYVVVVTMASNTATPPVALNKDNIPDDSICSLARASSIKTFSPGSVGGLYDGFDEGACANNGDNSPTKNASLKTLLQTIVR
eukprot:scaffold2293_cov81-Skeletonema_dohrnii-CCMP3373.AAC.9